MSDFAPGFASRFDATAEVIARAFAPLPGFATADIGERARVKAGRGAQAAQHQGFAPREATGPKHFSPADPDVNPTEGWDPLNPDIAGVRENFVEAGDPIEAARAEAYAEGLAAGTTLAREEVARDRALMDAMFADLTNATHLDRETVAQRLRQTVLLLVRQIVGETGVSGELIAHRVEAAVDLLSDTSESALLRLHPADVALVEGKLPKTVFAAGDATIERGSFVLESASTIVEEGPELWLDQLAEAIDRVPLPKGA